MNKPNSSRKTINELRSQRWFGTAGMRAFAHHQRMYQTGVRREDYADKPVIGIINTWSDLSTCHSHLRSRARSVKDGVLEAGGFPVELPALSLGEVMVKPTTMLYRNLLAMETEELIRSHPLDAVVLMGGCDKTTPGLIMGATHTRSYWDQLRAGEISEDDWRELESVSVRSSGTCNTMGTASTMALLAEVLGWTLPGAATIPAVDSAHPRMARAAGERAVSMAWEDWTPKRWLNASNFMNAITLQLAIGGSTNAVIHLIAMAGRAGIPLTLDNFADQAGKVPLIADLMPTGRYLMEDLYFAGGSRALFGELGDLLETGSLSVTGDTMKENINGAKVWNHDVIRPLDRPVTDTPALAVLRGNLAPHGAVIKPCAATHALLQHRARAVVFENAADMHERIDDPNLEVNAESILVLKNAGPVGAGMPEWGGLPIPQKLLRAGVRDMVRISDARMSGTHFGTCILHVAPEAAIGGNLALVENGDEIELDVLAGRIELLVDEATLAERRKRWQRPDTIYKRGFGVLHVSHVNQAPQGCDFDFLAGAEPTPEPDIY
jgi:dihydroxyacid dehydratase/phosphogluconate dehydratase